MVKYSYKVVSTNDVEYPQNIDELLSIYGSEGYKIINSYPVSDEIRGELTGELIFVMEKVTND